MTYSYNSKSLALLSAKDSQHIQVILQMLLAWNSGWMATLKQNANFGNVWFWNYQINVLYLRKNSNNSNSHVVSIYPCFINYFKLDVWLEIEIKMLIQAKQVCETFEIVANLYENAYKMNINVCCCSCCCFPFAFKRFMRLLPLVLIVNMHIWIGCYSICNGYITHI